MTPWLSDKMRELLAAGCMISLHSTWPGWRGERGLLYGPVQVYGNVWTFDGATATLATGLELPQATRTGRATHIGLWTRTRRFAWPDELSEAILLENGSAVIVERRRLTVGLG